MRDLMSRLKHGFGGAVDAAKRKASETKLKIDRKLNQNLFEAIIAGCVLIMNTSAEAKSEKDRASEEHNLLISLAEKGITNYFTQEEITTALAKYMSIFESGNFLAGYGFCVASVAQIKKEADIEMLIRFMYDVSAADGHSDPKERQLIADMAGFLGFQNYAVVEPQLTGFVPFRMSEEQRRISAPPPAAGAPPPPLPLPSPSSPLPLPSSPSSPPADKPQDGGVPDWMKK